MASIDSVPGTLQTPQLDPIVATLLQSLFGSLLGAPDRAKDSSKTVTSTSQADINPLLQTFAQQFPMGTPEGMQQIIQAIFQEGARTLPNLYAQAGAAGTRVKNNSVVQALQNEQAAMLSQKALQELLKAQSQTSTTAKSIADATQNNFQQVAKQEDRTQSAFGTSPTKQAVGTTATIAGLSLLNNLLGQKKPRTSQQAAQLAPAGFKLGEGIANFFSPAAMQGTELLSPSIVAGTPEFTQATSDLIFNDPVQELFNPEMLSPDLANFLAPQVVDFSAPAAEVAAPIINEGFSGFSDFATDFGGELLSNSAELFGDIGISESLSAGLDAGMLNEIYGAGDWLDALDFGFFADGGSTRRGKYNVGERPTISRTPALNQQILQQALLQKKQLPQQQLQQPQQVVPQATPQAGSSRVAQQRQLIQYIQQMMQQRQIGGTDARSATQQMREGSLERGAENVEIPGGGGSWRNFVDSGGISFLSSIMTGNLPKFAADLLSKATTDKTLMQNVWNLGKQGVDAVASSIRQLGTQSQTITAEDISNVQQRYRTERGIEITPEQASAILSGNQIFAAGTADARAVADPSAGITGTVTAPELPFYEPPPPPPPPVEITAPPPVAPVISAAPPAAPDVPLTWEQIFSQPIYSPDGSISTYGDFFGTFPDYSVYYPEVPDYTGGDFYFPEVPDYSSYDFYIPEVRDIPDVQVYEVPDIPEVREIRDVPNIPSGRFKDGGMIRGKGTGTSDSNTIQVSDGEYIIPSDVVSILGTQMFDDLLRAFHVGARK